MMLIFQPFFYRIVISILLIFTTVGTAYDLSKQYFSVDSTSEQYLIDKVVKDIVVRRVSVNDAASNSETIEYKKLENHQKSNMWMKIKYFKLSKVNNQSFEFYMFRGEPIPASYLMLFFVYQFIKAFYYKR